MENAKKPKLVFFQWNYIGLPKFLQIHRREHVKCLSQFFEVIVINEDCDYDEICDQYQPNITLFESSFSRVGLTNRLQIKNTSTYAEIPKLGFCNSDAYCPTRSAFISDMEHWGVETFFCLSVSMPEYTPEIADNLFVWPNYVDTNIYRDYEQAKLIPVLFSGSQAALYPWRQKMGKIISRYYPSLNCPHLGWGNERETSMMITGEKYAKLINASWFVPACGTLVHEVVRKHFEIPASRSCLITEKTPAIEACGFIDMQNCVFASESDVLDKLEYLFQNLDELQKITDAGYQLVHSHHTLKQRDQIFQWYSLYKNLKPNERIVQTSPFEPLIIVDESSSIKHSHIISNGLDRQLLNEGDKKLFIGKYDEAEATYLKSLNYFLGYISEPKLRLTLCNLYRGKPELAIDWVNQTIKQSLEAHKALDPDPIEWAYFLVSLLCQGKLNEAEKYSNQYPYLYHPELDRVRWVIMLITNSGDMNNLNPYIYRKKYRYSIHQLPNLNFDQWVDNLCFILKSCQQNQLAEILSQSLISENNCIANTEHLNHSKYNLNNVINLDTIKNIYNHRFKFWLKSFIKKIILRPLNYLETTFGYFLPYQFSEMRNDEFFNLIQQLVDQEDVKTALIIGASLGEGSTQALITGIQQNYNKPTVFCFSTSTPVFIKMQKRYANCSFVKCYHSLTISVMKDNIKKIKQENNVNFFDIVLIDGSEFTDNVNGFKLSEIYGAKIIILDDINTQYNYVNNRLLILDKNYICVDDNPLMGNGYAIFKKN